MGRHKMNAVILDQVKVRIDPALKIKRALAWLDHQIHLDFTDALVSDGQLW
jgi:hypothetical protein